MSGQEMLGLGRRLFVLALLVACLVVFSGERRSAQAVTCCTNCNNSYMTCIQGCGGDTACQETCGDRFDACESRCWTLQHVLC